MSRRRTARRCLRPAGEDGQALMLALVAASLLVSMGSALAVISSSDVLISAHHRDTTALRYAADAVLARALLDLEAQPDWRDAGTGLATSVLREGSVAASPAAGGTTVDLTGDGAVLQHPVPGPWRPFAWGRADTLFGQPGDADVYVIVWVSAGGAAPDPDALWLVARAYGGGGARRTISARVTRRSDGRSHVVTWQEVR